MEKAFKYRIYPNKTQQVLIQKTFGCCRFVYNYYLDKKIKLYESEKKSFGYNNCSKDLTMLKKSLEWLKEPDKDSLQKALKDLDTAYKNFFKNKFGYPKFKSKKERHKSYRTSCTNNNIKYLGRHIQLPKLGKVKITDKMIPKGRILNATVSQEPDGKYYVSLCCTDVVNYPLHLTNKNTGIDLGIESFATFSNGHKIGNMRFYEKSEKKLAKLQKEMSRKTKGGSNWNKARIKVARLQKHIAEQRRDWMQKLTTDIIRNYDNICIEDLKVSKMKEENLETNKKSHVRHKHIGDVSWHEFRRELEYKCKWYGKQLKIVDQYYPSSQICHCCGNNGGKKEVDIRIWKCKYCGVVLDRDVNAAVNILNEGMK